MPGLSDEGYQNDGSGSDSEYEDLDDVEDLDDEEDHNAEMEALIMADILEKLRRLKLKKQAEENSGLPTQEENSGLSTQASAVNTEKQKQVDISGVDVSDFTSEDESDEELGPQFDRLPDEDIHRGPNESEGDENARACFPCPFCYVDIEIQLLCCHLQDEHCFNLKDAVCPLCAASLGKDVTGHFIVQHGNLLKRRRKPKKTMLLNSTNGRTKILESVPDPLLLPFISSRDLDSKRNREDNSLEKTSPAMDSERGEDDEAGREERRQRAAFVQELIASAIFD